VSDVIIDARDSLAFECGRRLERASAAAIASSGRFSCALPGGSVAEACVPVFVHANVDWLPSCVFLSDERAVQAAMTGACQPPIDSVS
jgi:6-phosphogluconolactonase/glucosamine-6-phosphate isomerase/deaminase